MQRPAINMFSARFLMCRELKRRVIARKKIVWEVERELASRRADFYRKMLEDIEQEKKRRTRLTDASTEPDPVRILLWLLGATLFVVILAIAGR